MRALVTGGNGFVGTHLCAELRERGHAVVSAGRTPEGGAPAEVALELGDAASVCAVLEAARPDVVFHLAAQAFVPQATRAPLETYDVNVLGTARLLEALRAATPAARLVFVSSGEVYGAHEPRDLPLVESAECRPANAYAASKLAAEAIVLAATRAYGLDALVTRAFNHIGPGQDERFVVAAFAKRLAGIAAGRPPLLPVGDLTPQRDFLDVRDVARAYADLAERGAPGEIYNVCSGVATRVQDVLRQLVMAARIGVEIREDPALLRAVDVPVAYGDNRKLKAATNWVPAYPLARSLRDVYAAARAAQQVTT